jgi:hypothetical protein
MSWSDIEYADQYDLMYDELEGDEIIQDIIEQEFMDSCRKKMELMDSYINNEKQATIAIKYSIKGSSLKVEQFIYNDVNRLFSRATLQHLLVDTRFRQLVEFIGNTFGIEYSIYSAFYTMLILLREPKTINFNNFKPTSPTLIKLLE